MIKYISEEQIKEKLRINDFKEISPERFHEFGRMLPEADKEVAVNCISQIPGYTEIVANAIRQLNDVCDNILKSNNESQIEAVTAYKSILDHLNKLLENGENLSFEQKKGIIERMIDVAEKIAVCDLENKRFLRKLHIRNIMSIIGIVCLAAICFGIGISLGKRDISDDDMASVDEDDFDCLEPQNYVVDDPDDSGVVDPEIG